MGITINYKGKLDSPSLTDAFCDELEDIAQSMGWDYNRFDFDEKDETPVKGLFIGPKDKSEPLQFMIDKEGYLRNALLLEHFDHTDEMTFLNHTKTQYAPIGIHIVIIKLLKYLHQKYISNLEVWDEGDYWQTGDAVLLKKKMDFLAEKMDQFATMLESAPVDANETTESLIDKIEEIFKKLRNKNL